MGFRRGRWKLVNRCTPAFLLLRGQVVTPAISLVVVYPIFMNHLSDRVAETGQLAAARDQHVGDGAMGSFCADLGSEPRALGGLNPNHEDVCLGCLIDFE